MSTYLRLMCIDHNPPLQSEGESGQHLSDLPQIRADIAKREEWIAMSDDDLYGSIGWEIASHFHRNTVRFLRVHPRCRLTIRSEYGDTYPTKDEVTE